MSQAVPASVNIMREIFKGARGEHKAVVETTESGLIAGTGFVSTGLAPADAGVWNILVRDGQEVAAGDVLLELTGTAEQLGIAEDYIMGPLGFASGIATRARAFRRAAPESLSIACGGWKKLPLALKPLLRAGLAAAGVLPRLYERDFVYLSKNTVTMLGGVGAAINAGRAVGHGPVSVQVKSVEEALFALEAGAGIIMVDTGRLADLGEVHKALLETGKRAEIVLAFGGGVGLDDLIPAKENGADAVDVGRAILGAPLLDLRMRVLG